MLQELWLDGLFFDKDGKGGGTNEEDEEDKGKSKENDEEDEEDDVLSWDDWHKEQPEEVQELITVREKGLKSALTSERDARSDLQKKVRSLSKDAKDGSELQTKLTGLADELKASDQKSDFYEDAHKAGVINLKLAYQVAVSDDLFDRRGNANFGKLKEEYPELFAAKKKIKGDIGEGTGGKIGGRVKDMNTAIRAAAGKR